MRTLTTFLRYPPPSAETPSFSLSAVVAEWVQDDSIPDGVVNCCESHKAIRNSDKFMLVIEFHQNSINNYYVTTGAHHHSRK